MNLSKHGNGATIVKRIKQYPLSFIIFQPLYFYLSLQKKLQLDHQGYKASKDLIFLVGFMGTGKTHWGRIWATDAGYSFVDLDEFIEHEEGCSVKEIFEKKGEDYFRGAESAALRQLTGSSKTIVACGGGTPCFFDNMDFMNQNGTTVWLRAKPLFILRNIQKQSGKRPLLQGKNEEEMLTFIITKLREREIFYSQANITFDTDFMVPGSLETMGLFKK